jgi:hypothetical protein
MFFSPAIGSGVITEMNIAEVQNPAKQILSTKPLVMFITGKIWTLIRVAR